jgi:predicted alpha/beta superfamily hydrolase
MKKALILCLLFLSLSAAGVYGQKRASGEAPRQRPFVLGIVDRIQSAELGEPRSLNVYLPEGYSPDSGARYPVIYLLDGSANEDFVHVTGIVQFLTMIGRMPKTIIVGIANVDRKRDFTFPTTVEKEKQDFPTTGGSAKFIAFIEKELQPFVDGKYRTSGSAVLIGQSLGGLLATEILLKKPALFTDYIIVSPSLWWSGELLLANAPKLLADKSIKDSIRAYIAVGSEGEQMESDAKALHAVLQAAPWKKLSTHFVLLPEESHLTILHNSVYKVLTMMFPPPAEQEH